MSILIDQLQILRANFSTSRTATNTLATRIGNALRSQFGKWGTTPPVNPIAGSRFVETDSTGRRLHPWTWIYTGAKWEAEDYSIPIVISTGLLLGTAPTTNLFRVPQPPTPLLNVASFRAADITIRASATTGGGVTTWNADLSVSGSAASDNTWLYSTLPGCSKLAGLPGGAVRRNRPIHPNPNGYDDFNNQPRIHPNDKQNWGYR